MKLSITTHLSQWLTQHPALQAAPNNQNPFCNFAFLTALEQSGAVGGQSGWQPYHFVFSHKDAILAIMPSYLKQHSWGEYVFDQSWAQAYQQHGLEYYPKLISAIPFTPSIGPRVIEFAPHFQTKAALELIKQHCQQQLFSGWHLLFSDAELLSQIDLPKRSDCQFHWHNRGFKDFAHYVSFFSSRKRKNALKERQKAHSQVEIHTLEGHEFDDELLRQFYYCYQMTYQIRGRAGYLPFSFFKQLSQTMPEHMMMVVAKQQNKLVACALFFKDAHTLYGRYWGSIAEIDCLHFECCYYQGIEYAIRHQLKRFDPGTQGEHKIVRGFEPVLTHSAHYLIHAEFQQAVEHFVVEEQQQVIAYQQACFDKLPFKDT